MFNLSRRRLSALLCDHAARAALRISMMLGLVLCAAMLLAPTQARAAVGPIVQTKQGKVQGFLQNGVAEFLGIPYAAPPISTNPTAEPCSRTNLRWCPPVAHAPWKAALQATAYAPICAQIVTLGAFAGPANNNEDCLYLNVFTPNVGGDRKLPVIFWIHGGGNLDGETPGYDGSKMALKGRTVVVTVAYRVNLMGWLAHPALDHEGHLSANYGILDQQFALQWVHDNIARFGGDPGNVTVGGQSAGAEDTGIAMLSPLDRGLFDRGICESFCPSRFFPGSNGFRTLASAETIGVAFAQAAGCGSGSDSSVAACLRALPAAKIEALAGPDASRTVNFVVGPILDGTVIPEQPIPAFRNGHFNHVPLINGNVQDEANFFLAIAEQSTSSRDPITAAQFESYVNGTFASPPYPAGTAARVLAQYPLSAYPSPQLALDRVQTDLQICSERQIDEILASQIPLYTYEFDDETAPFYFPSMPGFTPNAYHTADIQYLFPSWHGGPTPPSVIHTFNRLQESLSDQLVAAWTNFAHTGNPNGVGNTPWPRYAPDNELWLIENIAPAGLTTLTDSQYAAKRHCALWDGLSGT
jgi:para-nitrobenzyl esterase